MNDLPEINFKEKKERKGFIPWLRSALGLDKAAMGAPGLGQAAIGAKVGTAAGAGLLAGKGMILTALIVAAGVGGGLYIRNQPSQSVQSTAAFSSNKAPDNYVPAILRQQQQSQGSSLDMFKEKNKGALGSEIAAGAATGESGDTAKGDGKEEKAVDTPKTPDAGNIAQDMIGKMMGGMGAGLSSSMGGDGNKFSNMGGFGNKFGQGATGPKVNFGSVGSGFQSMPKFNQRGKALAMKANARPVFSNSQSGRNARLNGRGTLAQARAVRATQRTYSGREVDATRSTQDKAWSGTTGDGTASGGAGVGGGEGAGIVTSPNIDNTTGDGGAGNTPDTDMPDTPDPDDESPWTDLVNSAMLYILISAILSYIGGVLVNMQYPICKIIGYILCIVAAVLAILAIVDGVKIMTEHDQTLLGGIYSIGGAVALVAAIMAMTGSSLGGITSSWMAAIAGLIAMLGSMVGSS